MNTLLLRLAAPMQAWGSDSKFSQRGTNREPTKSGVIGLLACALGRRRTESIDDIASLRFGVRVDQPGKLIRDYHTARKEWGSKTSHTSFVSHRYYLSDAIFVVGLESDNLQFLDEIKDALFHPAFPLFLGRRACPPTGELFLGIYEGVGLEDALRSNSIAPWQAKQWYRLRKPDPVKLDMFCDCGSGEASFSRKDAPVSFDQSYRRYDIRSIREEIVEFANPDGKKPHGPGQLDYNPRDPEPHDPMEVL
jgi:CRISPR system Cascade subunit CasD